ncbi:MarR family winged helix-turn-helix transcriptional regulator [Streptococcus moroccensis]
MQVRHFLNQLEHVMDVTAVKYDVKHLGGPQGHVILFLTRHPDREISIRMIEEELKISKSVASSLIKRMVKNGFIEVVPSQEDKRYKHVYLTELGCQKAIAYQEFLDAIHLQLLKDVSIDDLRLSYTVVKTLERNIESILEAETEKGGQ